MKLSISSDIFKKHPKLHVGIVVSENIDNTGSDDKIYTLLDDIQNLIKLDFVPEDLAKHHLISPWRAAYSDFGSKPSKYNSSVEALMKRILKGDKIPQINKFVDIYNFLSLKYIIPMGADDLDNVEGDIQLTIAKGDEVFVPLNSDQVENPDQGEVIYRDDRNVLCRRWNYRDCDKTKITDKTKKAILYIEGLPPVTKEKVEEICKEAVQLITMFCEGEANYHILDVGNSEVEI